MYAPTLMYLCWWQQAGHAHAHAHAHMPCGRREPEQPRWSHRVGDGGAALTRTRAHADVCAVSTAHGVARAALGRRRRTGAAVTWRTWQRARGRGARPRRWAPPPSSPRTAVSWCTCNHDGMHTHDRTHTTTATRTRAQPHGDRDQGQAGPSPRGKCVGTHGSANSYTFCFMK